METRIALIGIIVENNTSKENNTSVEKINALLHDYNEYIVGRMGVPYHQKGVSVISIIMDAPNSVISALSGKLGMLPYVSAKTIYSKIPDTTVSEN